jgi:hypothetical protein
MTPPRLGRTPLSTGHWGPALVVLGILERLALLLTYGPVAYGDSPSYMRLADVLAKSGFNGYDGSRVPGYPLLLALLGRHPTSVWWFQMGLGVAISVLLFGIGVAVTRSARWGFAAGLLYDLVAAQALFEANVLSETLTTFFILCSLVLVLVVNPERRMPSLILVGFLAGLAASLAGMARTLFYFLPVWLLPFVVLAAGSGWRRRLAAAAAFCMPAVLILGGWIAFIDVHYGMLSPTTLSGYNLVQHTGTYFDDLPDSEAVIRDTYIKYRDAQIAARGTQTNAIWDAIPELSQKTGLSFFALSRKLQALSVGLILTHPLLYLRDVATGWAAFWKAPVYWDPGTVHPAALEGLYSFWGWVGRVVCLVANGVFLLVSGLVVISRRARRRWGVDRWWTMLAGTIWISSIIQTLADHGDNPRFLIPLQMLVVLLVLWLAHTEWAGRREASPQA